MAVALWTEVCQNMRNRLESVREVTREALRGMLSQLGVNYLRYVIKALEGVLTKGFELHVLGHAIHDLLQHLSKRLVWSKNEKAPPSPSPMVVNGCNGTTGSRRLGSGD